MVQDIAYLAEVFEERGGLDDDRLVGLHVVQVQVVGQKIRLQRGRRYDL